MKFHEYKPRRFDDLIHAKKTTNRESDKLDLRLLEQAKKAKQKNDG